MRTILRRRDGLGMARRLNMPMHRRAAGGRGVLKLHLLRHGETEFSRSDRFCGNIDAPLTDAGRLMGEQFAQAYARTPWRAIVTSTRRRAHATAEPLATRTRRQVRRDSRLDEIYYGDWQGLTKSQAQLRDPDHYQVWPRIRRWPTGRRIAVRCLRARDRGNRRSAQRSTTATSWSCRTRRCCASSCRLLNLDLRCYRERRLARRRPDGGGARPVPRAPHHDGRHQPPTTRGGWRPHRRTGTRRRRAGDGSRR